MYINQFILTDKYNYHTIDTANAAWILSVQIWGPWGDNAESTMF